MVFATVLFLTSQISNAAPVCELNTNRNFGMLREIKENLAETLQPSVVGVYSQPEFRQVCNLSESNANGEGFSCSATLLPGNQYLLTSAHCKVHDQLTSVSCVCGKDKVSGQPIFARELIKGRSRLDQNYGKRLDGVDAQLAKLEKPIHCPISYTDPPPLNLPQTLDQIKTLIQRKDCYFSGTGLDNQGEIGKLHSVHAPEKFTFVNSSTGFLLGDSDPLTPSKHKLLEFPTSRAIEFKMVAFKKFREAFSRLKVQYPEAIEKSYEQQNIVLRSWKSSKPGRYDENGTDHGDSGGALICLDAQKKPYLLGLITNEFEQVTLVTDPIIQNWIHQAGLVH